MPLLVKEIDALSEAQFERISTLVKNLAGINLHDGKRELVKARLAKRIRQLGLRSFEEYLDRLAGDATGGELTSMLDAISSPVIISAKLTRLEALSIVEMRFSRCSCWMCS